MYSWRGRRRGGGQRSRAKGCLLLVLLVIVVLIVLSLMFGGFQKGTKSGSLPRSGTFITAEAGGGPSGPVDPTGR